jgi:hypothetical protein
MNHPELFQERKRLIGLAGGMEVAERARRERKRQQVDFAKRQSTTGEQGIVPLLNFCESFSRGMPDGMHADSRSLVKVSEPLDIMYVVKRGREREGKRVTRDASLPPLFSPTHQDLWERLNRHTWPDFSAPLWHRQVRHPPPHVSPPLTCIRSSADLWVYENGVGSPNPEWDAAQSTTAVTDPSIPWSIQYGKGEQEGFLNQDQVALGGYEVETVFAAATTLNEVRRGWERIRGAALIWAGGGGQAFAPYPISGIFGASSAQGLLPPILTSSPFAGLGFGVISSSGYIPWFER